MLDRLLQNETLLLALLVFSVACFVLSLVLIPVIVVRLPVDYFAHARRVPTEPRRHPALRLLALVLKNALGAALVLAGVAMLVLPGQGLLAIAAGLLLMDFPGKYALERRLLHQPAVRRGMNWIRAKAGRPPLA